ncbi:MAG: glycosyltransferase [Candidatus Muirbacterium halophilum]|nr:glycosyltransferase [Candidatus Muirbacterium halophilum]MCK9477228.1 glycosyltransferase [Candidatus Muirbacterium halophilum]
MKKSLLYVLNSRMPSEKGYGIQTVNSCNALSEFYNVNLCYQQRSKNIGFDEFYGIDCGRFKKNPIFTGELSLFYNISPLFWFLCLQIIFYFRFLFIEDLKKYNIIFTRDENCALILEILKRIGFLENTKVCFEAHTYNKKFVFLKKIDFIFTLTDFSGKMFERFRKNIFVLPDAVDSNLFKKHRKSNYLRTRFNVESSKKILLYTGKSITCGMEKGIFNIIEAVSEINDIVFFCVGGPDYMIEKYKKYIIRKNYNQEKFYFIDHVKYTLIPKITNSADIVLLYMPDNLHFSKYASPLKMFEYLCSGKPVILSELQNLKKFSELCRAEINFVEPENPQLLREKIIQIISQYEQYFENSQKNIVIAENFTWKKRAYHIKNIISKEI